MAREKRNFYPISIMSESKEAESNQVKIEDDSEGAASKTLVNDPKTETLNESSVMDVKAEEENDPTTNVALPLPPEETVAVAAMAVAAPDEELPVPEAVKAMETITETLSEKPKEEGKETIANEGNDKTADAVAEDVADKSKQDVKMEEAQSVEAAAAEAGLTVVTTNDTNMSSAPPLENPGIASTEESPYPYQVNAGKDVISGKGGKVQQYNRHFRNLVAESYPAYDATTSKIAKRRIGVAIYTKIIEKGGRFLDAQGNEMDRAKAVLKVMKALKDAKTWTSDAKRAAKERREAKQKEGNNKKEKEQPEGNTAPTPTDTAAAATNTTTNESPAPEQSTPTEDASPEASAIAAAPEESPPPAAPTEDVKEESKEQEDTPKEPEKATEPEVETKEVKKEKEEESGEDDSKVDKKAATAEKEKETSIANSRPRRSSKRRVQLPLNGSPPAKSAKKGSEEVVDSTNDAVRGLHLLSQATQAVARDKKKVEKV